jgi:hypothetical protein
MVRGRTFRLFPLLVYLAVYVFSCLLGASLILANYRPFINLLEYFSGVKAPHLTAAEIRTNLWLMIAAPAALVAGYLLVVWLLDRRIKVDDAELARREAPAPVWLPQVVFYVLAAIGIASLAHAGALHRVHSWFDYNSWIHARAANFSKISFAGFVNLYVLVPLGAAWVVLTTRGRSVRVQLVRWLPFAVAMVLSLLLFQKKAAVTTLLVVAFAWLVELLQQRVRGARYLLAGSAVALTALYLAVAVVPVYSNASHAVSAAKKSTAPTPPGNPNVTVSSARRSELQTQLGFHTHKSAIAVYSLVSPVTRSSAPALYYPVIFPRVHPYFRLDVGLDIAGYGAMPDDNIVVWRYLNPNLPGGTEMVPYQFVLFSQISTAGAVAASLIVGALLALVWFGSQARLVPRPWNGLLGALILLLAAYLGIDSLRNSLIVSYGVVWGAVFVGAVAGLVALTRRLALPRLSRPPVRVD